MTELSMHNVVKLEVTRNLHVSKVPGSTFHTFSIEATDKNGHRCEFIVYSKGPLELVYAAP